MSGGLFEEQESELSPLDEVPEDAPLAERVRPRTLEEYVGQRHLVGPGKVLARTLDEGLAQSLILWGPPGTGKTTVARLIAAKTDARFVRFSPVGRYRCLLHNREWQL